MTQINYWLKAPEWANAVVASKDGQEFYVSQFGGISARQRVGYSVVDHDHSADMIEPHNWSLIATRQTPWTGEGLPPVGTVCEVEHCGKWIKCEVIAHFQQESARVAAFIFSPYSGNPKLKELAYYIADSFRPTRTAEQIAADERLHAVRNALTTIKASRSFPGDVARQNVMVATVEAMIGAGYRKVEVKP